MALGRKTGGRLKGTPNKATAAVRELAGQYTARALARLAALMDDEGAPHQVRLAAANSLLDRAHGKPAQEVAIEAEVDLDAAFRALDGPVFNVTFPDGGPGGQSDDDDDDGPAGH